MSKIISVLLLGAVLTGCCCCHDCYCNDDEPKQVIEKMQQEHKSK